MLGLIEGRIVHYVNANGQHMAAIVVSVMDKDKGIINLQAFEDMNGIKYIGHVEYSDEHAINSWHWIEQEIAPEQTPEDDQTS